MCLLCYVVYCLIVLCAYHCLFMFGGWGQGFLFHRRVHVGAPVQDVVPADAIRRLPGSQGFSRRKLTYPCLALFVEASC